MTNWQPISTAPRDGEEILTYCKDPESGTDFYFVSHWHIDHWEIWWQGDEPTHWMPLPTPPLDVNN